MVLWGNTPVYEMDGSVSVRLGRQRYGDLTDCDGGVQAHGTNSQAHGANSMEWFAHFMFRTIRGTTVTVTWQSDPRQFHQGLIMGQ